MASVDSTSSSVSGRLRSGDLLHAGLAVALLLGELYFSRFLQLACHFTLFHHIPTSHQNIALLVWSTFMAACGWGNLFIMFVETCFYALCTFFTPFASVSLMPIWVGGSLLSQQIHTCFLLLHTSIGCSLLLQPHRSLTKPKS